MTSYLRRARLFLASLVLLYTVLVTYLLARTAWSHGGDASSGGSGRLQTVGLLDVLVQEEERHLQHVNDVMRHFRDRSSLDESSQSYQDFNNSLNNEVISPDMWRRSERPLSQQIVDVQVEEWDESLIERRKQSASRLRAAASAQANRSQTRNAAASGKVSSGSQNARSRSNAHGVRSRVTMVKPNLDPEVSAPEKSSSGYNLSFCLEVDQKTNLCRAQRYDRTHPDQVVLDTSTLNFKSVGNLQIYSAFLDPRQSHGHVRIMTLAPQGQHGASSVYWCVFDTPPSETVQRGSAFSSFPSPFSSGSYSQLEYLAASDGHQMARQPYILSCPLPAGHVIPPPPMSLSIRLVLGTVHEPMLGAVQEGIRLQVIAWPSHLSKKSGASEAVMEEVRQRRHRHGHVARGQYSLLSDQNVEPIENATATLIDIDGISKRHIIDSPQNSDNLYDTIANNNDDEDSNNNNSNDSSKNLDNNNNNVAKDVKGPSVNDLVDGKGIGNIDTSIGVGAESIVSCVAPLHGQISVVQLVEFLELTLLLGVRHVIFYTFQVSDDVTTVLETYRTQGTVTVMPWLLPDPESVWSVGRDLALNDCLYRVMPHYQWAIFHDTDEFFVPRSTPDLPSFISLLRHAHGLSSRNYSDLVFSSAYFPPPTKDDMRNLSVATGYTRDVGKMATLRSVRRSYMNHQHVLRMINASSAMRVGAGERKKTSFRVNSGLAAVHHFSHCPRHAVARSSSSHSGADVNAQAKTDGKTNMCDHTKLDWIMWRYRPVLIDNVKASIRRLHRVRHAARKKEKSAQG